MILGMSIGAFTLLHVAITLVAIGMGLIVVGGMFASHRLPVTTAVFLFTTALTSVTGFLFPIHGLTPALRVGILACLILAVALFALYKERLVGAWRWIFVITAVASLYLNVFVLVVQSFVKVSVLNALAPTQSEPPFTITQAVVLAIFILIALIAVIKFRPDTAVYVQQTRRNLLFALDLNGTAVAIAGTGEDHQIARGGLVLAAHQLADRSDCIDDGCARRVGHEILQRLQHAGARWLTRERKHIWLSRLKAGDRSLQHLYQPLVGERNARGRFCLFLCAGRRKGQLRRLASYAKRLQVESAACRGYGVGHVDERLRSLADGTRRDHFVLQRVNCGDFVLVLEADIDSCAIPRRPDAVR